MSGVPLPLVRPAQGLFVDGSIRSANFRLLIDTGATDTLISLTVYYQLPKEQRPELESCEAKVRQVDGSPLTVYGTAWVDLQIGRTVHPVRAVFADIGVPAMLGMNWLVPTQGSLDFRKLELCVNGERIKCTGSRGEPFVGRVVVAETIEIPPGHEVIVAGSIAGQCEGLAGPLIVEPVESGGRLGEKGLIMAKSLIEVPSEVVPIRVLNPNKEKRVLHVGTMAATVSPVEVETPPSREEDQRQPGHGLTPRSDATV